ncbi:beta-ketoacyl synthase N-terminal-like domain-containing protein (plasmid) [Rossellomorea sp. AcN35-11]|nr:hypothetical protein [Rossellomorea aquimaris]WJV32117.1 beta-ketoacyl synthase N-terminal-like domain-containing protein [Rossellomorea sp. AcN35-11]
MDVVVTGSGIRIGSIKNKKELYGVLKGQEGILNKLKVPNYKHDKEVVGSVVEENLTGVAEQFRKLPKASRILSYCLEEALSESKLSRVNLNNKKVGIIVGTTGAFTEIEVHSYDAISDKFEEMDVTTVGRIFSHTPATTLANKLGGVNGQVLTLNTGCTAGIEALALAKTLIETKQLDICFVGGVDTPITNTIIHAFEEINMVSTTENISRVSRPFDRASKGMAISEGAGLLVVESKECALERGVRPLLSVNKISANNDNKGSNGADVRGRQMLRVVQEIMKNEEPPSYVNSQALGVRINDTIEARVAKVVFAEDPIVYTSSKGHIGHTFGASGILQIISSIISMDKNVIFPTVNAGEDIAENIFVNRDLSKVDVNSILITTHGYGGNNAVCLLKKVELDYDHI